MNKNACCCSQPALLLMIIGMIALTYISLKQGVRPHSLVVPSQKTITR